jgi:superfamily II DNA or RNA helicase
METRDFVLHEWQEEAVRCWVAGTARGPYSGTLEIFTGGGKTLIALMCWRVASREAIGLKFIVVVPTQALAHQWTNAIERFTTIPLDRIGLLGGGKNDGLEGHDALVAVINTASAKLPSIAVGSTAPLMLVVDECHRAGADSFRRVLGTPARFRLGLSATPERDEFDEHGEPLRYDEQAVAQSLGRLVYRFGLKEARQAGWLPSYEIHHHGVALSDPERARYEDLTRQVDEIKKRLEGLGEETRRARSLVRRPGDLGSLARSYIAITGKRKDLLYKARARNVVAASVVADAYSEPIARRMILFHERVAEAQSLYEVVGGFVPVAQLALEHSKLPESERRRSVDRFRSGDARVLVSVKSLIEGIDVPEANVGISVASSASVRQRIQSLGRVLRRSFDETAAPKHAMMHVIYISGTVDEQIYAKEDWSDITGEANNLYWQWDATGEERSALTGPPREPQPSEETIWESFGRTLPQELPVDWHGSIYGQEYSADTRGNITNTAGKVIANPQGVGRMVEAVRGRAGGRFRVTPKYGLVIISRFEGAGLRWSLAGQLLEAFEAEDTAQGEDLPMSVLEKLLPGALFTGRANAMNGTFRLRQKSGGVIERKIGRDAQVAIIDVSSAGGKNGSRTIEAWRSLGMSGMEVYVSAQEIVWYREDGRAKVLAYVPGGFAWPPTPDSKET